METFNYNEWWQALVPQVKEVIANKLYGTTDIISQEIPPQDIAQKVENLEKLSFFSSDISDISFVVPFKNLKELDLSCNQITDISPLQSLENLKKIYLFNNKIEDISPLQHLKNLHTASLESNPIKDISPLKSLPNIKFLFLKYIRIHRSKFVELEKLLPKCKIAYNS